MGRGLRRVGQLKQQAWARLSGTEEMWKSLQLFDLVLGLFYVYECSACTSVPGTLRGRRGGWIPVELESWMVFKPHESQESDLSRLQEQMLTSEPFLQPSWDLF